MDAAFAPGEFCCLAVVSVLLLAWVWCFIVLSSLSWFTDDVQLNLSLFDTLRANG